MLLLTLMLMLVLPRKWCYIIRYAHGLLFEMRPLRYTYPSLMWPSSLTYILLSFSSFGVFVCCYCCCVSFSVFFFIFLFERLPHATWNDFFAVCFSFYAFFSSFLSLFLFHTLVLLTPLIFSSLFLFPVYIFSSYIFRDHWWFIEKDGKLAFNWYSFIVEHKGRKRITPSSERTRVFAVVSIASRALAEVRVWCYCRYVVTLTQKNIHSCSEHIWIFCKRAYKEFHFRYWICARVTYVENKHDE